jgi:hypothetical protein
MFSLFIRNFPVLSCWKAFQPYINKFPTVNNNNMAGIQTCVVGVMLVPVIVNADPEIMYSNRFLTATQLLLRYHNLL